MAELNIVAFDSDLGIDIQSWLIYFDNLCNKDNKKSEWKLENVSKYLYREALKIYISDCLNCSKYDQIANYEFVKITAPRFYVFLTL